MIYDLSSRDPELNREAKISGPRVAKRNRRLLNEALLLQHAILKRLGFTDLDADEGFDSILGFGWGSYMLSDGSGDFRFYNQGEPSGRTDFGASLARSLIDGIGADNNSPRYLPWEFVSYDFRINWSER